jgi:hypothetical protein
MQPAAQVKPFGLIQRATRRELNSIDVPEGDISGMGIGPESPREPNAKIRKAYEPGVEQQRTRRSAGAFASDGVPLKHLPCHLPHIFPE